jgi:signal transduction histidine kinase
MLLSLLLRSAETGKMQVSPRIPLTDEGVERSGFVVSVPVYYKDEPESETDLGQAGGAEPAQIRGFAFGIFRTGDIVEQALESLGAGGIDMRFYEDSPAQGQVSLYTHTSRMKAKFPLIDEEAGPEERLEYRQSIPVGEQRWAVVCTPITGRYDPDPWSGWIVLAGGIPFTVLLTVYVGTLVGRARKVNQLVEQRTEQLQEAVQALNREITERKRAEAKLKILNDDLEYWVTIRTAEAERRAQDLEQFAYVASHDLKAPLRAIGNLADWIGEDLAGKLNTESQEQLMLLKDRVRRMNALIEGLLEYSRVGRTEGSIIEVDTRELLEELIDSLSPGKGFIIDIDEEMPVFRTDRLLLGQVFSNLISNSLKHHKGDCGHIQIGVHDKPAFFEFHVSDDGVGIAPEHHEKVFMIFQILEAKDYGSNTGIGLALVKKIVREQGGVITLKSEPGHGAHFYFTWPKEPPSVAA